MNKKISKSLIWFYILAGYILIQFMWWAFHLAHLSDMVYDDPKAGSRILMIVSEGAVFFVILLFGVWQLQRSIKREISLSREQKNFLLATTHELKTPISSVKLYLETLQKRKLEPQKKQEVISVALKENDRLNLLIDKVLLASRIESGHTILNISDTNAVTCINEIIDTFQKKYPSRIIEAVIQTEIKGQFDKFALSSILENLLDNALKYSPKNQTIALNVHTENNMLVMMVSDKGSGIENIRNVKKLFYREQNEETRTKEGSGLGLYIVDQLCHLHNGKLRIESTPSVGTSVTASIKLKAT